MSLSRSRIPLLFIPLILGSLSLTTFLTTARGVQSPPIRELVSVSSHHFLVNQPPIPYPHHPNQHFAVSEPGSTGTITITKYAAPQDGTDFFFTANIPNIPPIFILKWGNEGSGHGQFSFPNDVTVDDNNGNVYVVDSFNYRIQKFDSNGNFLRMWGWGVDTGAAAFEICTPASLPCQAGILGSGDGQFNLPDYIEVGGGNIFVPDVYHRIQMFDTNGAFLLNWGTLGSGDGNFFHPRGVVVDSPGHVYVADSHNHRIQKFDSDRFALDDAMPDDGDSLGNTATFNGLVAGTYFFTETLPAGWFLADIVCDGGATTPDLPNQFVSNTLAAGDHVTCTFENIELRPAIDVVSTTHLEITWDDTAPGCVYDVHEDATPDFTPPGATTYASVSSPLSLARIGDANTNYFFIVEAICGGTTVGYSKEVGEFDYALVKGSP